MINIDALNDDEKLAALESIHKSIAESKEIQKKKITTNVELIVKALKKIESDLKQRYDETGQLIANLKNGEDGRDGKDGKDGKNGRDGRDGPMGPRGYDGLPGRNGIDGADGVSITDAHIDFDGSLIISLSSGRVINVGEVVAADIAEKIKVITNGGGTSQGVLDAIASLQAQIDSIASGLVYQGTWNASTNNPALASGVGTAGYYYIVAVAGSTNLNGVTDWQVGDWALFNGTVWQKLDQTNLVTSVAGRTGAVTLTTADIGGLGTIATQAANNVSITGGSITGITDLAIADGGTGASTAAAAITALTGTQTAGRYLRSDGTNAALAAIVAADVPTLNQNTTGTAAGLSATLATTSGGTGLTSFTANGVVYASSTSALATGSALTFNGTTFVAPLTSLSGNGVVLTVDRTGTGGNDRTNVQFSNSGTVRGGIGTVGASDGIYFNQGTTEGMRLTSTGLVLGSTSNLSSGKISALADLSAVNGVVIRDSAVTYANNDNYVLLQNSVGSTAGGLTHPASQSLGVWGFDDLRFLQGSGATEQMRLNSTGLGIGVTNPASKLDVLSASNNIAQFSGAANGYVDFTNGTITGRIQTSGSVRFGSITNHDVAFLQNNTEVGRLTSTGLGIGTTAPVTKLQVNSGSSFVAGFKSTVANGYIALQDSGTSGALTDGNVAIGAISNDLAFRSGGATRMRLDSAGNLGLGVTPSAWGNGYKAIQLLTSALYGTTSRDMNLGANVYVDAVGYKYIETSFATNYTQYQGAHSWYTAASGTAGNAITFTQAMTLDASGNFMVGQTSATGTNRLSITTSGLYAATFRSSGTSGVQADWAVNGSSIGTIGSGVLVTSTATATDFGIGTSGTTANLVFATGAGYTERARIDSSGNLLVGTTSAASSTKLDVVSSAGGVACIGSKVTGGATTQCYAAWNSATTGDNVFAQFYTEATATSRGSISYNRAGGLTAYNTTSDYRAKDIIGSVTDSGSVIDSVPVYMGKMHGATQERPMFIAHETPAYAHTGEKDAVDTDGNPVYQQMDASALIPVMWAEIQSLRKRLADAGL